MPYRIVIKGLAGGSNAADRSTLDGIDCQDDFAEYFHTSYTIAGKEYPNEQCLIDKGVRSGYMRFKYIENRNIDNFDNWVNFNDNDPYGEEVQGEQEETGLYVIVTYRSREKLTEEELEILKDYTKGQMSDGIGEGFEQYPVKYEGDKEIYLSPWYFGQELTVTQTEV